MDEGDRKHHILREVAEWTSIEICMIKDEHSVCSMILAERAKIP